MRQAGGHKKTSDGSHEGWFIKCIDRLHENRSHEDLWMRSGEPIKQEGAALLTRSSGERTH